MSAIDSTETVPKERKEYRIFSKFWMDYIRVGGFEKMARKNRNDFFEEVVYVAVECVIAVVESNLKIFIGGVVT
jgi:hypothetical protein